MAYACILLQLSPPILGMSANARGLYNGYKTAVHLAVSMML